MIVHQANGGGLMDTVVRDAACAVADIVDGACLAVGGFGLAGVPNTLIAHQATDKRIEKRTVRCESAQPGAVGV
jgi:acyl CoA:acetate/3-ketoacid CoA transferase alpha subunit